MPRRWLWFAAPLIVWLGIIFATSCTWIDRDRFVAAIMPWLPGQWLKAAFSTVWDNGGGLAVVKGYHVVEFALLFALCYRVLGAITKVPARRAALWSGAFCLMYAASDEWHQTFVPGRGGTWVDVVIDSVGIGAVLFITLRRTRRSQFERTTIVAGFPDPAEVNL